MYACTHLQRLPSSLLFSASPVHACVWARAGSLELEPFSDVPSCLFWGGFAWIYVMQWILYNKVSRVHLIP
jgi:hypothetical protein